MFFDLKVFSFASQIIVRFYYNTKNNFITSQNGVENINSTFIMIHLFFRSHPQLAFHNEKLFHINKTEYFIDLPRKKQCGADLDVKPA